MQIEVITLASMEKFLKNEQSKMTVELASHTKVKDLIQALALPEDEHWVITVNGRLVSEETELAHQDTVMVFPMFVGG